MTNICNHIESIKQIRVLKLSDLEVVALNITAEYMSTNSELKLFRYILDADLDGKIERSVYNRRKRKFFSYIEEVRENLSGKFSQLQMFLLWIPPQLKSVKSVG